MNKERSRLGAGCAVPLKEAERQGLFSFHFFIKENDLGTTEEDQTWLRGKSCPGEVRGEQKDRRVRIEKNDLMGQWERRWPTCEERALMEGQKIKVAILTLPQVPAFLWASVSTFIYSFTYANSVSNAAGGDGLTEINRAVPALQRLIRVDR